MYVFVFMSVFCITHVMFILHFGGGDDSLDSIGFKTASTKIFSPGIGSAARYSSALLAST